MDDTLKTKSEINTTNKDGAAVGSERTKASLDPKRKGSFKEWITSPIRKFGHSRSSMRQSNNKNNNKEGQCSREEKDSKATLVAAATAAAATITAIEHISTQLEKDKLQQQQQQQDNTNKSEKQQQHSESNTSFETTATTTTVTTNNTSKVDNSIATPTKVEVVIHTDASPNNSITNVSTSLLSTDSSSISPLCNNTDNTNTLTAEHCCTSIPNVSTILNAHCNINKTTDSTTTSTTTAATTTSTSTSTTSTTSTTTTILKDQTDSILYSDQDNNNTNNNNNNNLNNNIDADINTNTNNNNNNNNKNNDNKTIDNNNNNITKESEDDVKKRALEKRRYVVEELVETERHYVRDLGIVVKDYMATLESTTLPVSLEGKYKIVFGNVQQIHEWHEMTFLKELEKCLQRHDLVGDVFNKYGRRLHMYVKYCENKPKSEYLVAENMEFFEDLRVKLGHRLQLSDLLIKPIQRIMKYQLLLKDITKQTGKAGVDKTALEKALELMNVIPKAANDMMMVGRLQGFEGKITAQGKLLLQEALMVCEVKGDRIMLRERRVFLFEQVIIFADVIERKKALLSDSYIYKGSIMITKLSMEILPNECEMLDQNTNPNPTTTFTTPTIITTTTHDNNNHTTNVCNCGDVSCGCSSSKGPNGCACLRFMLINKGKSNQEERITCQAKDPALYYTWLSHIQSLLDMQGDLLKALQSPIAYQKGLSSDRPRDENLLQKTLSHPPLRFPFSNNNKNDKHNNNSNNPVGKNLKPKMNLLKNPSLRVKKSSNPLSSKPPPSPSSSSSKNASSTSSCQKNSIMEGIKYTILNLKSKSQEDLHKAVSL